MWDFNGGCLDSGDLWTSYCRDLCVLFCGWKLWSQNDLGWMCQNGSWHDVVLYAELGGFECSISSMAWWATASIPILSSLHTELEVARLQLCSSRRYATVLEHSLLVPRCHSELAMHRNSVESTLLEAKRSGLGPPQDYRCDGGLSPDDLHHPLQCRTGSFHVHQPSQRQLHHSEVPKHTLWWPWPLDDASLGSCTSLCGHDTFYPLLLGNSSHSSLVHSVTTATG